MKATDYPPQHRKGSSWATNAIAVAYLSLCVTGAWQTGSSWDEDNHRRYGELALDFYRSLGQNRAATTDGMRFYGALHAIAGAIAERTLQFAYWPFARHLVSVAFGLVGLAYCVRLARLIYGPWAGVVAALLLAATPRWTGHAMFNPIDIPMAAMFCAALFYLARIVPSLPRVAWLDWTCFGVAAGLTGAVRMGGGLLLLSCAILLVVAWILCAPPPRRTQLRIHGPRLFAGFVFSVAAMLTTAALFWPRLMVEPLATLTDTLGMTAKYPWPGSVFFRGKVYPGSSLPWTYLPTWLAITIPPATMIGGLLAIASFGRLWRRREQVSFLRVGVVIFAMAFPVLWATVSGPTLYDGMRHFLFVLPPITALAAVGWLACLTRARARSRSAFLLASGLLAASLSEPIVWYARSHPFEYVYFNPIIGGLSKASHDYETDYWGLSLRSAAEVIARHRVEAVGFDGTITIATDAPWHLLEPWFDEPTKYRQVGPEEPYHLALRGQQWLLLNWREDLRPVRSKTIVRGQVPFWQLFLGPACAAVRASGGR